MYARGRRAAKERENLAPSLVTKRARDLDILAQNMMNSDDIVLLAVIVVCRPSNCVANGHFL